MRCKDMETVLLTHGNAVKFGGISMQVVVIESVLGQANRSTDCRIQGVPLQHSCGENFINEIHRWDYHSEVGCRMGKEQCCVLEDLWLFV